MVVEEHGQFPNTEPKVAGNARQSFTQTPRPRQTQKGVLVLWQIAGDLLKTWSKVHVPEGDLEQGRWEVALKRF